MKWFLAGMALCGIAYASTGVYTVGTDQRAVVRRFGRVVAEQSEPGIHFGLPWGLDQVDLVKPSEPKTIAVGLTGPADRVLGVSARDSLAQFLSGDQNLVNVQATVQYTIADPIPYLFLCEDPAQVVAQATESAITGTLADQAIDTILTSGKDALAILIKGRLQDRLAAYGLGIDVRSVSLTDLAPPPQVADAFTKAASARSDRERLILESRSYANERLAQARSDAQQATDKARADRDRSVDLARSESDRFLSLLYEYRKAPAVAATRLYLESMSLIIPRMRSKLIVDPGQGVDITIMREER